MDVYLDPALSSRRTAAGPARDLAAFPAREQGFVLHWGAVIARDNAELAYQFTAFAPRGLRLMDLDAMESWLLYAMDLYDKKGQTPAIRAFQDVEGFAANMQERLAGVALEDVSPVLERFVCGLNGRPLKIALAERCHTDTESIFLPGVVGRLPEKEANFRLYKAMTVHQWAQGWYGTWRGNLLLEVLEREAIPPAAIDLFHALETVRLDACLERDLPGLHRDMQALRLALDAAGSPQDADWQGLVRPLRDPDARVRDTLALWGAWPGNRRRPAVTAVICCRRWCGRGCRCAPPWSGTASALRSPGSSRSRTTGPPARTGRTRRPCRRPRPASVPAPRRIRICRRASPTSCSSTASRWPRRRTWSRPWRASSRIFGEIPPEYLVAAGPGLYKRGLAGEARDADTAWAGTYHEEGAFAYDEWDHSRAHHRKGWCVLREHEVKPAGLTFYHGRFASTAASSSPCGVPSRSCAARTASSNASPTARTWTSTPWSRPMPMPGSAWRWGSASSPAGSRTSATSPSCSWWICPARPRDGSTRPSARP